MNPDVVENFIRLLTRAGVDYDTAQVVASRIERRLRKARAWKAAAAGGKVTNARRNAAGAALATFITDLLQNQAGLTGVTVTFQPNRAQVLKIEAAGLGGQVEI